MEPTTLKLFPKVVPQGSWMVSKTQIFLSVCSWGPSEWGSGSGGLPHGGEVPSHPMEERCPAKKSRSLWAQVKGHHINIMLTPAHSVPCTYKNACALAPDRKVPRRSIHCGPMQKGTALKNHIILAPCHGAPHKNAHMLAPTPRVSHNNVNTIASILCPRRQKLPE